MRKAILWAVLLVGCQVPTQVVPLRLEPAGTRVFVDGLLVDDATSLTLRSDRPHVLHLEREGHRAQQVVLESRDTPSGPQLTPARVSVRLERLVPTEQQIEIHGVDDGKP